MSGKAHVNEREVLTLAVPQRLMGEELSVGFKGPSELSSVPPCGGEAKPLGVSEGS